MLHAKTMNRDGDPARGDAEVDFAAFDAGPGTSEDGRASGDGRATDDEAPTDD
jgi:glycerol-3-phosphate dehydrogenase